MRFDRTMAYQGGCCFLHVVANIWFHSPTNFICYLVKIFISPSRVSTTAVLASSEPPKSINELLLSHIVCSLFQIFFLRCHISENRCISCCCHTYHSLISAFLLSKTLDVEKQNCIFFLRLQFLCPVTACFPTFCSVCFHHKTLPWYGIEERKKRTSQTGGTLDLAQKNKTGWGRTID